MKKMEKFEISDTNNIYDISKCVEFTKDTLPDDFETILEDIPEYHNSSLEKIIITNIGILVFKIGDEYIGYNLLETESFDISSLKPDFTSTLVNFTEYANPLGVRIIPVNKDRTIGTKIYKTSNNVVSLIDCDYIKNSDDKIIKPTEPDDNNLSYGLFTYSSETFTNTIGFDYKQSRTFKFINCSANISLELSRENDYYDVSRPYYILYAESKNNGKKIYYKGSVYNNKKLECSYDKNDAVRLYIEPTNKNDYTDFKERFYIYQINDGVKKYIDIDDTTSYSLKLSDKIKDATHFLFDETYGYYVDDIIYDEEGDGKADTPRAFGIREDDITDLRIGPYAVENLDNNDYSPAKYEHYTEKSFYFDHSTIFSDKIFYQITFDYVGDNAYIEIR